MNCRCEWGDGERGTDKGGLRRRATRTEIGEIETGHTEFARRLDNTFAMSDNKNGTKTKAVLKTARLLNGCLQKLGEATGNPLVSVTR